MNRRSYNSNSNKNRTQARFARIRDKATKLSERVKQSMIAFHETSRVSRLLGGSERFARHSLDSMAGSSRVVGPCCPYG